MTKVKDMTIQEALDEGLITEDEFDRLYTPLDPYDVWVDNQIMEGKDWR